MLRFLKLESIVSHSIQNVNPKDIFAVLKYAQTVTMVLLASIFRSLYYIIDVTVPLVHPCGHLVRYVSFNYLY